MHYYTYGEDILFINFIFDFILLFFAQKLVLGIYSFKKTLFSSFLGSVYSLLSVLYPKIFINEVLNVAVCFLMVVCICGIRQNFFRNILPMVIGVYGISFLFSGPIAYILQKVFYSEIIFIKAKYFLIIFIGLIISLCLYQFINFYKNRIQNVSYTFLCELSYKDRTIPLHVYFDSGNRIGKYIGKYVIFVNEIIIKNLIYDMNIENYCSYNEMLDDIKLREMNNPRIVFMKVSTMNCAVSELLGVIIDSAKIEKQKENIVHKNVIVIFSPSPIEIDGIQGLINKDILFD